MSAASGASCLLRSPDQPATVGAAPANPVQRQLAAVAASLVAAAAADATSSPTAATPPAAPAPASDAEPSSSRADVIAEIKQLEAAMSALAGASMQSSRNDLQALLDEKRRTLRALKPLGQRLDAARAAMSRSTRRREQAEEAKRLASDVLVGALKEEEQLKQELADLEASVGQECAGQDPAANGSFQSLGDTLAAVVEQLRGMDVVDAAVAADAQAQCELLYARVHATMKAAEEATREAASAAPRRMRGKQAPPAGGDAPITVTHRIVGKRKVRSHLTTFWAPGKVRRSLLGTLRPAPALAGGARCAAATAGTLAGAPCTYGPVPLPAGAADAGPHSQ